jgi:hypothetical protein
LTAATGGYILCLRALVGTSAASGISPFPHPRETPMTTKATWSRPQARAYGSFAQMTREDITVCKFKSAIPDDGGTIGPISIGDDTALCS